MKDHVRDVFLKTPLNKGNLLKNVKDEGSLPKRYVIRADILQNQISLQNKVPCFSLGVWTKESGGLK